MSPVLWRDLLVGSAAILALNVVSPDAAYWVVGAAVAALLLYHAGDIGALINKIGSKR